MQGGLLLCGSKADPITDQSVNQELLAMLGNLFASPRIYSTSWKRDFQSWLPYKTSSEFKCVGKEMSFLTKGYYFFFPVLTNKRFLAPSPPGTLLMVSGTGVILNLGVPCSAEMGFRVLALLTTKMPC